jgi:hypothetical protein
MDVMDGGGDVAWQPPESSGMCPRCSCSWHRGDGSVMMAGWCSVNVHYLLLRVQGDAEAVGSMLSYGRSILSQVVDENRRRCGRAAASEWLGASC